MGKSAKIHDISKKKESAVSQPLSYSAMTPFEEMEHLMENLFSRHWLHSGGFGLPRFRDLGWQFKDRVPAVDVVDREDAVVVKAELPGVKKDQLDVSLTDNRLTIKASAEQESKEEKDDYYRSEIHRGSFSRTVSMPCAVDADHVVTSFKDGLLELTFPKLEKAKKRTVKIE